MFEGVAMERSRFKLNPMAIKKGAWKTTWYTLSVTRKENLQILFAITIVQELLLWITSDHDIAKCFVQALEGSSHFIVFRPVYFHLPILILVVLQIFRWIQAFVNLSD